jgi:hypothetical protein
MDTDVYVFLTYDCNSVSTIGKMKLAERRYNMEFKIFIFTEE